MDRQYNVHHMCMMECDLSRYTVCLSRMSLDTDRHIFGSYTQVQLDILSLLSIQDGSLAVNQCTLVNMNMQNSLLLLGILNLLHMATVYMDFAALSAVLVEVMA